MPRLLWHRPQPKDRSDLVVFFVNQGVLRAFTNPDPHGCIYKYDTDLICYMFTERQGIGF